LIVVRWELPFRGDLASLPQGNAIPEELLVPILVKLDEMLSTEGNVLELSSAVSNHWVLFMGNCEDRGFYSMEPFADLATRASSSRRAATTSGPERTECPASATSCR
jgi:hypothetical protein